MKRILSAVIAVVMMMSVLAGCADKAASQAASPTPAAGETAAPAAGGEALSGKLRIWTHQNEAWNSSHKAQIAKFTALHPGVTIEYESFPYTDFSAKVQTSLLSGDGADIYELWGGWALGFTPTGALSKVPESLSATMKTDFYKSTIGLFELKGDYYGVPLEYNIEYGGMLVNKKLFAEKNLAYPTTWAELEKVADATSKRNGAIMDMRGFEFATPDAATYLFLSTVLAKGGSFLTDGGYKMDLSSPEAEEAMTKMVEYIKVRNWTNLDGLGGSQASGGGLTSVYKNEAMMAMVGPWSVTMGTNNFGLTYGTDFEYVLMPTMGDEKAFASETGWGLVVSEKSKQKELAWAYVQWLMQPENLIEHNIACGQVPANRKVGEDPKYLASMPYMKSVLEILPGGQFIGFFNTDTVKRIISDTFTELVTTNNYATVSDGLKAAQDKINALNS